MRWYQTSLGKKYIMAASGAILVGYAIVHMLGNLTIYAGPGAINTYAEKLHQFPPLIWGFRALLLSAVLLHICLGVTLYLEKRAARPVGYARKRNIRTTFAAETMIWTGLLLGTFVTYHLLHFTARITNPDISFLTDVTGRPDVHAMVVLSFQRPLISAAYVAAMVVLLLHLYHGIQSIFQSVGLNGADTLPAVETGGRAAAVALLLGFASIPVAILSGILNM